MAALLFSVELGVWSVEFKEVSACADGLECGSFVNDPYKRRSHFPSLVGAIHESPGFNRAKRTFSLHSSLFILHSIKNHPAGAG